MQAPCQTLPRAGTAAHLSTINPIPHYACAAKTTSRDRRGARARGPSGSVRAGHFGLPWRREVQFRALCVGSETRVLVGGSLNHESDESLESDGRHRLGFGSALAEAGRQVAEVVECFVEFRGGGAGLAAGAVTASQQQ